MSDYEPRHFPPFAVTVDMVLLTVRDGVFSVLLVERGTHPFLGALSLPGGFVQPDEDLDTAAVRRLERETGVRRNAAHVEQLGAFGAPDRDPRMRVVSVAYLVFAPRSRDPRPGGRDPFAGLGAGRGCTVHEAGLRPREGAGIRRRAGQIQT